MKFRCKGFSVIILIIIFWQPFYSQTTREYNARTFGIGARASSLSEAFTADAYNIECIYWNPGALSYLNKSFVVINHTKEISSGGMAENIAAPLYAGKRDAIAVGLTVSHLGYIDELSTNNFRVMEYGYDIVYARKIISTVSLGTRVGVRYGHSESSNLWAVSSSFGVFYSPSYGISYGVALNNLGTGIRYTSTQSSTALSSQSLSRSLQVGASMRYPAELRNALFIFAIANEKIFGQDGLRYKGGIEVMPIEYIAARVGYSYITPSDQGAARYGLGVRVGRFQVDYAISPSKLMDLSYDLSFSFDLWNHESRSQD